jgi:uncharacterized protein (DUF1810 family)
MDVYDLQRFTAAQVNAFPRALAELHAGRKRSCWMWFVCPTPPFIIDGEEVGSTKNRRYAIRSAEEGRAFLHFRDGNVDLRANYLEVLEAVVDQLVDGRTLVQLFGRDDAPKFKSSLEFFRGLGDYEVSAACDAVFENAVGTCPSSAPQDARSDGFGALLCSWIGL